MKSIRETLKDSLSENSFSAAGSRTPGSRTNPILRGYVQAAPELMSAMVGSRMNEIEAFCNYHGYDRNMIREVADQALASGRVPDLSSRLPDTYDKATIARFISDVMLGLGESAPNGPGSTTTLMSKTQKDFDEEDEEESILGRFGFKEAPAENLSEEVLEEVGPLDGLMELTGSKVSAGVSRDLHSTYIGHDLAAISTGGRRYSEIYLQPNHIYFMQEQGENRLVLVTEVRDDGVRFYGDAFRVERCMNRSEANDRIFRGTQYYMESKPARAHPRLVESFAGMMNRRRSNLRHLLEDCRRVRVLVNKADDYSHRDLYHDATQYGIVEEKGGGYEILIERSKLHHIKKSRVFKVKKIEERLEGLGCVLGEEREYVENHLSESWEDSPKEEIFEEFTGNPEALQDNMSFLSEGEDRKKEEAINPMWQNSFGPNKDFDEGEKTKYAKADKGKTDDGKGLDKPGEEDSDVDNDGDSDSSDSYLLHRRRKISKAIKGRKNEGLAFFADVEEAYWTKGKTEHGGAKKGKGHHGTKKEAKKGSKKERRRRDKKAAMGESIDAKAMGKKLAMALLKNPKTKGKFNSDDVIWLSSVAAAFVKKNEAAIKSQMKKGSFDAKDMMSKFWEFAKNAEKKRSMGEGLEPSREKGLIVRDAVHAKARELAAKAQGDQKNWVWGESGEENVARSRELMAAVRMSADWWAHHYHQYLWCCNEATANKLSEDESVSADENGVEEMKGPRAKASKKNKEAWAKMSPEEKKKFDKSGKEMPHTVNEEMEYHHVRVSDPDAYQRIRTVTFGKGIKARIGFNKGEGSKAVSLLFPKGKYSHAEAKAWAKKHAYKIVKSMKAESETWETPEKGALIEAYKVNLPGKVVEIRGDLAKIEWTEGYDGPDIVHLSRLRLQGKSSSQRRQLPQPHLEDIEPEDPFLDTLLEHPCYGGNSFSKAMEIMEHKPDRGFKSPLFDLEETVIYDDDPGIRDSRIESDNDNLFGTVQREDEFFLESEDPHNSFNAPFWGISEMRQTLKD